MVHMQDAMRRHLQRFFEYALVGMVPWDRVRLRYPAGGEGDVVEADFGLGRSRWTVKVQSPDADPRQHPHGQVFLNDRPMGALDELTWGLIARKVRGDGDGDQATVGSAAGPDRGGDQPAVERH
jgi:hypothetical protein